MSEKAILIYLISHICLCVCLFLFICISLFAFFLLLVVISSSFVVIFDGGLSYSGPSKATSVVQFAVSPASFEGMEVWTFTSHVSTLTLTLSGHEFIPRFIF